MSTQEDSASAQNVAAERLAQLLGRLAEQGLTQVQAATRAKLPPQYLSDIKRGRRPMTELVARRLGEEFDVNFEWLLGVSHNMEAPTAKTGNTVRLPLFSFPIQGEPRADSAWDGAEIELAGAAAQRVSAAKDPYVLRFGKTDPQGRLCEGDLILISQEKNEDAEFQIVEHRKKLFLARANPQGGYIRIANGNELPASCPVAGHCVGIVWAALD